VLAPSKGGAKKKEKAEQVPAEKEVKAAS